MGRTKYPALAAALALMLVLGLLVGCGPKAGTPGQGQPEGAAGPEPGGTLFIGSLADVSTMNGIHVADTTSDMLTDMVDDSLVDVGPKLEYTPLLAERWETSSDGTTWTFYLRKNVKWHDGHPFTAEDVVFTYLAILHPEYTGVRAKNYSCLVGAEEYQAKLADLQKQKADGKLDDAQYQAQIMAAFEEFKAKGSIKALTDYAVQFVLKEPYAPFLDTMGINILPAHVLKDHMGKDMKDQEYSRKPIGCGAWRFVEWVTGERVVVEANPDYWGGRPYLDRIVVKVIPDQNTMNVALETQEIDCGTIIPEDFDRFKAMPHLNIYEYPELSYTYLGLNLLNPLFQDVRVRQAIAHAIDRETMIKEIFQGHGIVAHTHGNPICWDYNPDVPKYPYDPAKARQLLSEAGWSDPDNDRVLEKDGKEFAFTLMTNAGNKIREQAAVVSQEQLKAVGMKVTTQLVEWSTFVNKHLLAKNFEAVIVGWRLSPDPDSFTIWHSKGGPFNFVSYSNAQVDSLLEQGRRETDMEKRKPIYAEIQRILALEQPYVFLYFPNTIRGINKRVQGPIQGHPLDIFYNVHQWYIPKAQQGTT
ncbi:MAG: peptide-binding protein [Acetobacteraceae bacterium]|nr:peptide-binding protein [Acetobacteraceae bacterium]